MTSRSGGIISQLSPRRRKVPRLRSAFVRLNCSSTNLRMKPFRSTASPTWKWNMLAAYAESIFHFQVGDAVDRKGFMRKLVELQFKRTNADLKRGTFRLRGDNWEIMPPDREVIYNFELEDSPIHGEQGRTASFDRKIIKKIYEIDPVQGFRPGRTPETPEIYIAPAKHFVTLAGV